MRKKRILLIAGAIIIFSLEIVYADAVDMLDRKVMDMDTSVETATYETKTADPREAEEEVVGKLTYEAYRTDGESFFLESVDVKEKNGKYIHIFKIGHGYKLYNNDYYYKNYCDIKNTRLPMFSGSRYSKVKQIYEYILSHVSYDESNYDSYSTFVNGKGLCEGQAALFYRMCRMNNIPCHMVYGTLYDEKHAWNAVKIDDWYYVDVTNGIYKNCFLRGVKSFSKYQSEKAIKVAENDYLEGPGVSKERMFFKRKINNLVKEG